jgi:hypothetical protein
VDLRDRYWLTRWVFLRALGFIYCVAFLALAQQLLPLLGRNGLLPAQLFVDSIAGAQGGRWPAFLALPSLFFVDCSDTLLWATAWIGFGLSLVVLLGFANLPLLVALWALYMSFVHIGQIFYSYGWEILLLETGFLAIFLVPWLDGRSLAARQTSPPVVVIWLLRWLLFRVMLGAGLIKLRGDACWRDLTCLQYHYETQPLPNPLSWYLHWLPAWWHQLEVLFNHFVELVVPWSLFAPRRLRHIGGLFLVAFQLLLIVSGNLSWLNWLTLALCIACFDDAALARCLPSRWVVRLGAREPSPVPRLRQLAVAALGLLVVWLSVAPVRNMLGAHQVMNGSFDTLHLVNTYGAFGSVGKLRHEVILEGTTDSEVGEATQWREYQFKCKPGDVMRRPCVIAPYQYRIDWQVWFAAMQSIRSNPWLLHLIAKLLHNDPGALSLLANNPFPEQPPKLIRAELYEYSFTPPGDASGAWWTRRRVGSYVQPLAADTPLLVRYLVSMGWTE